MLSFHLHFIKPTSSTKHFIIISLLEEGYSLHQIQSKTGLWKSTIGIINKATNGDKGKSKKEFLSKLSLNDKSPIIHQTTNWRLDNAVEATHFIKNIFPDPITLQTVRNALKQTTGIGRGYCGQMRPESIRLGQMKDHIFGRKEMDYFLSELPSGDKSVIQTYTSSQKFWHFSLVFLIFFFRFILPKMMFYGDFEHNGNVQAFLAYFGENWPTGCTSWILRSANILVLFCTQAGMLRCGTRSLRTWPQMSSHCGQLYIGTFVFNS